MKQQGVDSTAKTVAQFLSESRRFNGYTMEYRLSDVEAKNVPFTVIIDESSMLTEEMFGALLQALRKRAQRIIFVGDPNQLPPIGAGRPFVDLVRKLNQGINQFPKVGPGFGQLTVTMRQLSDDGNPRVIRNFPSGTQVIPSNWMIVFSSDCKVVLWTSTYPLSHGVHRKNWNSVSSRRCMKKPR